METNSHFSQNPKKLPDIGEFTHTHTLLETINYIGLTSRRRYWQLVLGGRQKRQTRERERSQRGLEACVPGAAPPNPNPGVGGPRTDPLDLRNEPPESRRSVCGVKPAASRVHERTGLRQLQVMQRIFHPSAHRRPS